MTKLIKRSYIIRSLVRWMSALPLLPRRIIWKGFKAIGKEARKKRVMAKMLKLFQYWCRTWRPKISVLSVCGSADRTNNASESDNRMLQDAVTERRPNVWDFVGKLPKTVDFSQKSLSTNILWARIQNHQVMDLRTSARSCPRLAPASPRLARYDSVLEDSGLKRLVQVPRTRFQDGPCPG